MKKVDKLQRELPKMKRDKSKKKLAFDSKTGDLVVIKDIANEKSNQTVIDQIYQDGFFALAG